MASACFAATCVFALWRAGNGPGLLLWAPAGIALACLVRWGPACWPGAAFGLVAGSFAAAEPPAAALASSLTTLAGALCAAVVLVRLGVDRRLGGARDTTMLFLVATGIGAVVSSGSAVLAWRLIPALQSGGTAPDLGWRWIADATGMALAATPMLLTTRDGWRGCMAAGRWRENASAAAATLLAGAAMLLPGTRDLPGAATPLIVVLPLLAWVTLRGGLLLGSTVLLLVSIEWAAGLMRRAAADPGMPAAAVALSFGIAALCAWILVALMDGQRRRQAASEARLHLAFDAVGMGVAEWNAERRLVFRSARWLELLGDVAPGTLFEHSFARLHHEDRATWLDALEDVCSGRRSAVRCEVRTLGADGATWIELNLTVAERERVRGRMRLIATTTEIGERRDAEERQRVSASLFRSLHEGLLITDSELRTVDVNPAYSLIVGIPREELIGRIPSLLLASPPDPLERQHRSAMWAAIRTTGTWHGEITDYRRNGERCTLRTTVSTVHDDERRVSFHLVVVDDITLQRQQSDRLERQAHFDELTRLPNRTRLSQVLTEAMAATERDGNLLTVCYIDLDRFKAVNENFGHAAGDRLLVELAGRLRSAMRSNEFWSDTVARFGGDEFALLLRTTTMEEARLAVERVLRVVAQPYTIDPTRDPVQVTASIGATVFPADHSDADTLLRHADHAMYDAKQAGRNGILFFDPEHRRLAEERVIAIGRVQEALDRGEFLLYYQPKVDMRRGTVVGLEALLRWQRPKHGLVAPQQFLPLIENTGLSVRVGDWVLGQALDHLATWRQQGLELSVSVNVSARHLQEADFSQRLSELLARHPEPLASVLELEVLETAAHADIQSTSALLERCRALGVRFALDDFGTGYSTLTYLKQLPVDVLKIDRSFVHHMLDDAQDRAIVEGVIGLAKTFGCVVVAEGVESPAQARTLLEMGCDIGQGTGIAAPMPSRAIPAWVREYKGLFALSAAPLAVDVPRVGSAD